MGRKRGSDPVGRDYAILSRRRVFESEIKSLRHLMDGGYVHIWAFLSDSGGEYSDKKTQRFIGQAIEEKQYQKMHEICCDRYTERLPFYRNLLYCVIRTVTAGYTDHHSMASYSAPDRILFSNLTDAFEGNFGGLLDWNCVFWMKRLYELLTGERMDFSLLNPGPEEWKGSEENAEELAFEESFRAMEDELGKKLGYDMAEIRKEEEEEYRIMERRQEEEDERIRAAFPSKRHFCRSVREVLSYLENDAIDARELESEMKEFIFRFLSDRRLSVFDGEEAFVEVMVQLKKTIRKAQRYTED